ncbi:MAG TPA: aryl-sulfate sulfotransferase [Dehalococcoidales bacterium]|nr:aryl-sulfate sulfotransferase [Dehalococcoidales bacterium]
MPVSVFPTGVVRYHPEKCWNGFTLFQASMFEGQNVGTVLIDMNGKVVKQWKGLEGFPNKMLPGGYVMGSSGVRDPKIAFQDMTDLVQLDWEGRTVWQFNHLELIEDAGHESTWMARQHHDYQREGNPVGYYAPGLEPQAAGGRTLILAHRNVTNPAISPKPLLDDIIIEVDWQGNITWEWSASDHFEELDFPPEARQTLNRNPNLVIGEVGDWLHINSISTLGPNRRFEAGDARFHPENIIWSSRQASIMAIIERSSGRLVWKLGPDYSASPQLIKLGAIIGQHHIHLIPRGLPGEGNLLLFDNGGTAGYGPPGPASAEGLNCFIRDYSRVIELDPVSLEAVWQYPSFEIPGAAVMAHSRLYSKFVSSAQRLLNGNTLITEGGCGRFLEVTPRHEIVWEYISPYYSLQMKMNHVYRAYRIPPEWVPQLELGAGLPVIPAENHLLRLDTAGSQIIQI